MKLNILFAVAGIGFLMAGCVTSKNGTVLEGVGPGPTAAANATADVPGTLLVYSAYEINADFNSRDAHRPQYSDYQILTPDGKLQQRVHNSTETILQRPKEVALPAGKYRVVAEAN